MHVHVVSRGQVRNLHQANQSLAVDSEFMTKMLRILHSFECEEPMLPLLTSFWQKTRALVHSGSFLVLDC
jgi:hypothetical protein